MTRRFKFEKTKHEPYEEYEILSLCNNSIGYIKLKKGLLTACICTGRNYNFIVYGHTFKNEINQFADDKQREKYLTKIELRLKSIVVTSNAD